MPQHYKVKCPTCGMKFDDDGLILECPVKHEETILITEYATRFEPDKFSQGVFRYHNWLPVRQNIHSAGRTVTYQSQKLSQILGLPNLWIAFNGYWKEKGATLETATFKELEAYVVLSRLSQYQKGTLVVASAGNTAAAFAFVCSQNKIPCLIVVPASGLARMKFFQPLDPCVKIISLVGLTNYDDAIALANNIARQDGFFLEGGVKNVGRRDGMGTTMLNAVESIGHLPDYYFQAIGSGAGAIAVHEMAKRLIADGNFGQKLPRLMLSQNFPFVPMYNAWKLQQRQLILNPDVSKQQIKQIVANVLSNQRPPYSAIGGVFDILNESQGDMLWADNQETLQAIDLFQTVEGVTIEPAGGVALASLIKVTKQQLIDNTAHVLLHITGGRYFNPELNRKLYPVQPTLELNEQEISTQTLQNILA